MSTTSIKLTGWKAIIAVVIGLGFLGFRFITARQALDVQGRQAIQEWIALELQRPLLADTTLGLADKGEALLGASTVEIRSLRGHGSLDDLVVRVELEPNDELPSGTELVRYYRMEYSTLAGWRHRGRATALTYYLSIF